MQVSRHVKFVSMANFGNADAYYENIHRELNSSSSLWCKYCSNFVIFFLSAEGYLSDRKTVTGYSF